MTPGEERKAFTWSEGRKQRSLSMEKTSCIHDLLARGELFVNQGGRRVRKKAAASSIPRPVGLQEAASSIPRPIGSQEVYTEPDWSQKEAPAAMELPFTILFVGVDNGDRQSPELNLKAEYQAIETALKLMQMDKKIRLRQIFFSNWGEVMAAIQDEKPSILHLGSHSTGKGIELFREIVTLDMIKQIEDWNEHARARGWPQIRMVATNSCDSDRLAWEFAKFVDFAIGHFDELGDDAAVLFVNLLYSHVFELCPLLRAFRMARSASGGYRLYASKNPTQMLFVSEGNRDSNPTNEELDVAFERALQLEPSCEEAGAPVPRATDASPGVGSGEFGTSEEYPVVAFLKKNGLGSIVNDLRKELGLEQVWQLCLVTREQLDKLHWLREVQKETVLVLCRCVKSDASALFLDDSRSGSELQLEQTTLDWIKDVPQEKLLKLCMQVSADGMSPSGDDQQSQASTAEPSPYASDVSDVSDVSDSDTEEEAATAVVAARNIGDVKELQAHVKHFILDFVWQMSDSELVDQVRSPSGQWSFCMLLWILFLKDAQYKQGFGGSMQRWLRVLRDPQTQQDEMARQVQVSVEVEVASHPLLGKIRDTSRNFPTRPYVTSIAILDCMAQRLMHKDAAQVERWRFHVIREWYISESESHRDVLQRANDFLRSSVDGISVLLAGVETQSYVCFMRMTVLVEAILWGFLEARRLELASPSGVVRESRAALHGFTSFVSSQGHLFRLTRADAPGGGAIVAEGLRCMARLGAAEWEAMGSVQTVREMVSGLASPSAVPPVSIGTRKKAAASEKSSAAASEAATALHTAAASMAASARASAETSAQPSRQLWELGGVQAVREIISDPALETQPLVEALKKKSTPEPSSEAASGATTVAAVSLATSVVAATRGEFCMRFRRVYAFLEAVLNFLTRMNRRCHRSRIQL